MLPSRPTLQERLKQLLWPIGSPDVAQHLYFSPVSSSAHSIPREAAAASSSSPAAATPKRAATSRASSPVSGEDSRSLQELTSGRHLPSFRRLPHLSSDAPAFY